MVEMQPMLQKLKPLILICLNYERLLQIDLLLFFFPHTETAAHFYVSLWENPVFVQLKIILKLFR